MNESKVHICEYQKKQNYFYVWMEYIEEPENWNKDSTGLGFQAMIKKEFYVILYDVLFIFYFYIWVSISRKQTYFIHVWMND